MTAAACVLTALAGASRANAAYQCQASGGVATPARASGVTEQVGDLVLNCTGGTPTASLAAIPAFDITVHVNTKVTSRLLSGSWSEPLLLLDEPPQGTATLCASASGVCTNHGNGTGTNYYVRNGGQNFDAFQGEVGLGTITFKGVPIDPPGGGTRVLRIANVRANASLLPVNESGQPNPIVETIDIPGDAAPGLPNPTQAVAFIQRGFKFAALTAAGDAALAAPIALPACADLRKVPVATLSYKELFATAFKRRNTATALATPAALSDQNNLGAGTYNTESAFYDHGLVGNLARGDAGLAGLADSGARLKATFTAVPAGAHVSVNVQSSGSTTTVARLTAGETGAYAAVGTGVAQAEVPLVDGTGTAVWEVLDSDPAEFADLRFAVFVDVPANAPTAGGVASISGDMAPTSSTGDASSGPVPRFADTASAIPLFSMGPCAPPAGSASPDVTPPVVQSAAASPKSFRVDPKGSPESAVTARAAKGTTLRYELTEASRAVFTITRSAPGRRSRGRCVKPTRANRDRKRCTRFVRVGRFALQSAPGVNRHRFSGLIGAKKLRPGAHRATLVATDMAGNHSAPKRFGFKIVRR